MEKLRQALKTLSEAEKQLRTSNDKLTWLTAALLQLAPDQQYMLPSSSADTSFNRSPLPLNNAGGRDSRKAVEQGQMPRNKRGLLGNVTQVGTSDKHSNGTLKGASLERKRHFGAGMAPQPKIGHSIDNIKANGRQVAGKSHNGIEEIWQQVLEKIHYNGIRGFLFQEGKLVSISFGAGN